MKRALEVLAVLVAALASYATSPPRHGPIVRTYPREFPQWKTVKNEQVASGCARVRPWIAKSGKEGFGLVLDVERGDACEVSVIAARFASCSLMVHGSTVAAEQTGRVYVPFVFDNEALWNDGCVRGRLDIALRIAGEEVPAFSLEVTQARADAHREVIYDVREDRVRTEAAWE